MRPTLVYGFGPYREFKQNITGVVLANIPPQPGLFRHVFEVVFDRLMFEQVLDQLKPELVLGLGQCRPGEKLKNERTARNVMASSDAVATPIEAGIGEALALSLDIPAADCCELSNDAGSYVCNFSMWVVEQWCREHQARFGFIHVPADYDVQAAACYVLEVMGVRP